MNLVRVNTALKMLCNPFCITVHLCGNRSTYTASIGPKLNFEVNWYTIHYSNGKNFSKSINKRNKKKFFFKFSVPNHTSDIYS